MKTLCIHTVVDKRLIKSLPALQPMTGRLIELVVRPIETGDPKKPVVSFDELMQHRLSRPKHIEPVSLEQMARAIEDGAVDAGC